MHPTITPVPTRAARTHRSRLRRERARAHLRALRDCGERAIERYARFHPVEFARDLDAAGWPAVAGGAQAAAQVVPALPFTAGAHEHVEPAFTRTVTPGTTVQRQDPIDIPAYGYITNIFLEVVASGGTGGTIAADGPWNALTDVTLQDVNGSTVVGPINGYELMVANLFGGYSGIRSNPQDSPWFVGSAPNPAFYVRIPVEISHKDALGALTNQNTSANYKLTFGVNTSANMFSVAPSPLPTLTIRGWLEAWTLPAERDSRGNPQAQVPPMLGTGQYISVQGPRSTVAGTYSVPFTRLGNYLRAVPFITRDVSGVRTDASLADPIIFNWDGMQIKNMSQRVLQQHIYERVGGAFTRPTGVWALPFNFGGEFPGVGNESPNMWLPTSQSSRLSLDGTAAAAGSTTLITIEVAPIEVNQAERYEEHSGTGWNPGAVANVPIAAGSAA
jgi:hypothetical protein